MVDIALNTNERLSVPLVAPALLSSFESFKANFSLHGEALYATVFDRHKSVIQTQKLKVAVANLEKILEATFSVSATSGFDRMSLRDLSGKTGMSMGAIYSCISKKEDIALMIADIVRLSSQLTRYHAEQSGSRWEKIERNIRFHLYASTLLQPWYFFMYFETRCLPEQQQQASKKIELDAIASFEQQIQAGVKAGVFETSNPHMVANTIVILLEDWYLKPWKIQEKNNKKNIKQAKSKKQQSLRLEQTINAYNQSVIELVIKLLKVS